MKILISVIVFLMLGLSVQTIQSQPLSLIEGWTTNFNWNSPTSFTTKTVWDPPSGILIAGHKETGTTIRSAIIKLSPTGGIIYQPIDTLNQSTTDLQFCVVGGKIFYNSSGTNGNTLVVRNATTGNVEKERYISSRMSFCGYGDSVITITSSSSARVVIMNSNGDSCRSFPLGYSLTQGFVSVEQKGNDVWLCGLYYSSGYHGFIEKRNLISGALLWRKNFNGAQPMYATLDTAGNSYVVGTYAGADSIVKLNTTGEEVWSQTLSSQYIYVWDVVVDTKNQIAITVGATTLQGKTVGFVVAKKINSGDSVFTFPVIWNTNLNSNGITGVSCDTSGNFFIAGYGYTGNPTCYARKYHYDTMTGITVLGNENPIGFNLSQNYPNPFNPTTKINFSIPKSGLVTIKLYNILGKEVATLVNELKNAGSYAVDFNGSKFSSGTYFYKIQAGEYIETKSMILAK